MTTREVHTFRGSLYLTRPKRLLPSIITATWRGARAPGDASEATPPCLLFSRALRRLSSWESSLMAAVAGSDGNASPLQAQVRRYYTRHTIGWFKNVAHLQLL